MPPESSAPPSSAGEIDHALFMVVECTNGRSVPPAGSGTGTSCEDIGRSNVGAPPMGAHFYLDMTDDEIDAASASYWKKAIMRAPPATASMSATRVAAS